MFSCNSNVEMRVLCLCLDDEKNIYDKCLIYFASLADLHSGGLRQ